LCENLYLPLVIIKAFILSWFGSSLAFCLRRRSFVIRFDTHLGTSYFVFHLFNPETFLSAFLSSYFRKRRSVLVRSWHLLGDEDDIIGIGGQHRMAVLGRNVALGVCIFMIHEWRVDGMGYRLYIK